MVTSLRFLQCAFVFIWKVLLGCRPARLYNHRGVPGSNQNPLRFFDGRHLQGQPTKMVHVGGNSENWLGIDHDETDILLDSELQA